MDNKWHYDAKGNVESMMNPEFSVDGYLSKCGKIVNLETMLSELEGYLDILKSTKLELINADCEQYIRLASKLSNFDERIIKIKNPLNQFMQDIDEVKNLLKKSLNQVDLLLNNRRLLNDEKQNLRSMEHIQMSFDKLTKLIKALQSCDRNTTVSVMMLERIVAEKNICHFHLQKCDYNVSPQHLKDYELLSDVIVNQLNDVFLANFQHKNKNIGTCLYLYFTLNKIEQARSIISDKVVAPVAEKLINIDFLKNQPLELEGVYSKIIEFIDTQMKPLLDVTLTPIRGISFAMFNFMIFSVWPEIERRLRTNLKCIFLTNHPDTFHKRYMATLKFMIQFEERCSTTEIIKEFRSLPSYDTFIRCWNLPIYFQLRYQDIAGTIENVIINDGDLKIENVNEEWKLSVTREIWKALNMCWAKNIIIKQLTHRFWKLNLQILSRYSIWIKDIINTKCKNMQFKPRIAFLIDIYNDGMHLIRKSCELLNIVLQHHEMISSQMKEKLRKSLEESQCRIQTEIDAIKNCIIDSIVEENISIVRQVNDIPRLFRRTNRDNPTQPCSYVSSLLSRVIDIKQDYGLYISKWLPDILSAVTSQYYDHITEVLTSVQKTEESLRRIKKIRDPSGAESKGNTDDDKIRLQLQVDIQNYINIVDYIIETSSEIKKLEELKIMLNSLKVK